MAVPGQDERDWEFAMRFDLPIIRTVQPPAGFDGEAYIGDGPAINSANDEISLDGLGVDEAQRRARARRANAVESVGPVAVVRAPGGAAPAAWPPASTWCRPFRAVRRGWKRSCWSNEPRCSRPPSRRLHPDEQIIILMAALPPTARHC
jgi:hypothetical protein